MQFHEAHLTEHDTERVRDELETFRHLGLTERLPDATFRPTPFMQGVADLYTVAKAAGLLDDR